MLKTRRRLYAVLGATLTRTKRGRGSNPRGNLPEICFMRACALGKPHASSVILMVGTSLGTCRGFYGNVGSFLRRIVVDPKLYAYAKRWIGTGGRGVARVMIFATELSLGDSVRGGPGGRGRGMDGTSSGRVERRKPKTKNQEPRSHSAFLSHEKIGELSPRLF